jgi:Ser/Thr protein kinase RdoA (MazF antagonist)
VNAVAQSSERAVAPSDILLILRARGYFPDGEPFAVGRPDRTTIPLLTDSAHPVVAKIYSDDGGEACFTNMQALWSSSFGERRDPPGLPRPIEYLREHRVLVLERVAGRALAEMGEPDAGAVQDAVRLAAALHGSDARPTRRRSARGILRSLRRKAERITRLDSMLGAKVERVVDAVEESRRKEHELVPSHGDFSPRNVLVGPDRSVLIDWDRFQLADPARDVAYFGTWCWVDRLRRGETRSWSVLEDAAAAYEALRPESDIASRLAFHVAAGLVRIAEGLVTLWTEDAHLAPLLLEEALSRGEGAL